MMFYVSADGVETAREACEKLQSKDLDNCYISPLTSLCCVSNKAVTDDAKNALRLDMLSVCDVLLVASEVSKEMQEEIDFARLVGMEVRILENR